jgi:ferredoxin
MAPDEVYRRLAERLNRIPNGFPSTDTGIELKLLAHIFTPEQAELATMMRLIAEKPEAIAERAGLDPAVARQMLNDMVRDGLVRAEGEGDSTTFGLLPFVVGIYEFQLHRMDATLAALFEEYYQQIQGGPMIREAPQVHRVIPVEETIDFDLEIFPHERASELVDQAQSWGVRDCICRVQRRMLGHGCDHPVENCITFSTLPDAYVDHPGTRPISKDEALRILREAEQAGLVHSTGNYRDGHMYICNCCTCSCGILRGVAEFGVPSAIARSDFIAAVDESLCAGCEDCVARCQFSAIAVPDYLAVVDYARCVGCGQCVTACSTGALSMARRADDDRDPLPSNLVDWMLKRAQQRGMSFRDILQ